MRARRKKEKAERRGNGWVEWTFCSCWIRFFCFADGLTLAFALALALALPVAALLHYMYMHKSIPIISLNCTPHTKERVRSRGGVAWRSKGQAIGRPID